MQHASIAAHPSVLECAVVSTPDPQWGEVPAAFVVRKPGRELSQEELGDFLRGRIAKFKMPKKVIVVAELPRNTMGKVQKNILRDTYSDIYSKPK